MEDCNPGHAMSRQDKQIVAIQKKGKDKRLMGPVQAGEQTYLVTLAKKLV